MSDNLSSTLLSASDVVAPRLLGSYLRRTFSNGAVAVVKIVETEAYSQTDAASHSYRGRTPRTDVMFGPPGYLYVYFTYGMHYCCNIVTGPAGEGAAVLIRGVEPVSNEALLAANRRPRSGIEVTNGPAKLCQALEIDRSDNGLDLREPPLELLIKPPLAQAEIIQTTRIGISQAKDQPWRFFIKDNAYVSKQ